MSEVNPYQAPQTRGQAVTVKLPGTRVSTTAFVLIFLAICLGVATLLPWLGIFFLVCSTPVFIRYSRHAYPDSPSSSQLFRVVGNVALLLSIFLASVGAFWGTCHTSAFATAILLDFQKIRLELGTTIFVCIITGTCVGLICGGLSLWQLRRLYPRYQPEEPEDDREEIS